MNTTLNIKTKKSTTRKLKDVDDLKWVLVDDGQGADKLAIKVYGKILFVSGTGRLTHGSPAFSGDYGVLNEDIDVNIEVTEA